MATPSAPWSVVVVAALILVLPLPSRCHQLPPRGDVAVGRSLDVFRRYGSLVHTVRTVPPPQHQLDDEEEEDEVEAAEGEKGGRRRRRRRRGGWVLREPTHDVFVRAYPARAVNRAPEEDLSGWEFRMSFCASVEEVMKEYFRHFLIDGLKEPWRAFAGSWERKELAGLLGIEESYTVGDHRYVFVSVSKTRSRGKWYVKGLSVSNLFVTTEEPAFNRKVSEAAGAIVPGELEGLERFFRRHGTHYLSSYVTGDSVFQVFVYDQSVHRNFETIMIKRGMRNLKLRIVSTMLSPIFALHLGKVRPASGNATVEDWIEDNLEDHVMSVPHYSILKCFRNEEIRRRLEAVMSDEVVLRLELRSLGPSIRDRRRREWFEEVLRNRLMLWEANA